MARVAVLSDVHGNAVALAAVRKAIKAARPDFVLVAGDHVLNGPEPGAAIDGIRELEAEGALVVQGNTDVAVADFDYTAAFPWLTEGVPDSFRAAAEWAHEAIGDDGVAWLRRLPFERRLWVGDTLVLVTHASPGSQTQGFDQALDASVVFERAARTDARIICCGHTHVPEIRDLGFKRIVNDGSAGYVFDGDPTASWALLEIDETAGQDAPESEAAAGDADAAAEEDGDDDAAVAAATPRADGRPDPIRKAEIRRTEFDVLTVANAISARGLPGDVYRAATVRTGKPVR
jgi:predicted phosphodiesterase